MCVCSHPGMQSEKSEKRRREKDGVSIKKRRRMIARPIRHVVESSGVEGERRETRDERYEGEREDEKENG